MMPLYRVTEKATRLVGGTVNLGVGTVLALTSDAAARDVDAGALIPVGPTEAELTAERAARAASETEAADMEE